MLTTLELSSTTVSLWNQTIEFGDGNPSALQDKEKLSDDVGLCD